MLRIQKQKKLPIENQNASKNFENSLYHLKCLLCLSIFPTMHYFSLELRDFIIQNLNHCLVWIYIRSIIKLSSISSFAIVQLYQLANEKYHLKRDSDVKIVHYNNFADFFFLDLLVENIQIWQIFLVTSTRARHFSVLNYTSQIYCNHYEVWTVICYGLEGNDKNYNMTFTN